MKRLYLEKVYFQRRTPNSLKKNKKKKRIIAAGFTKKSGENISKVLIQVGSVKTKILEKYTSFFTKKRKISKKVTLVDNKENAIFQNHLVSEELNKFFENATKSHK